MFSVFHLQKVIYHFEVNSSTNIMSKLKCYKCAKCSVELKSDTSLQTCDGCHNIFYCSRNCQVGDWKNSHKKVCAEYKLAYPNKCVVGRMTTAVRKISKRSQKICQSLLNGKNLIMLQYVGDNASIKGKELA